MPKKKSEVLAPPPASRFELDSGPDSEDELPLDPLDDGKEPEEAYHSDPDSADDAEYEPAPDSEASEDETKEEPGSEPEDPTNEEELLEELYGDEDEEVGEEELAEEEPPDEILIEGGDEDHGAEETRKRKAPAKRADSKRKLFPFIQKKRRLAQADDRDPPDFWGFDMRDPTCLLCALSAV